MKYFFNFLTVLFLLTSCANIVAPTGGDQDISAPQLLNVELLHSTMIKRLRQLFLNLMSIFN